MKVLSYGMVGGGPDAFIGDAHRKAINLDGKAKLVAGCFSRSADKTQAMGLVLGVDASRCYKTYVEMAKAEAARPDGINFVVVVTPNNTHYEICKAFLEAGINVSCDKPLVVDLEQAEELDALANAAGLLFMVTYTYQGHVTAKNIREIIKDGEIGEIRTVMAEYPQGWLADENSDGGKQGRWRMDPAQSGRVNALGDIGTHIENTVATMTGLKVKKVLAKMDAVVPGRVLDDNDFVLVQYDSGATGMYWSSQFAIGCDNGLRVRIYGSKGTVEWFQERSEEMKLIHEDGEIKIIHRGYSSIKPAAAKYQRLPSGHGEGWIEAMANLYTNFIECLFAKAEGSFMPDMIDFPTAKAGVDGLRYIEACLKSNKNGNVWVDVK